MYGLVNIEVRAYDQVDLVGIHKIPEYGCCIAVLVADDDAADGFWMLQLYPFAGIAESLCHEVGIRQFPPDIKYIAHKERDLKCMEQDDVE
ncbi:hypothetical protein D3H65_07405 [Paraflavitalea soli]|uniref:Uncharacterized protein n=1 Tax=Paraflavitalea soli TaxID=2315862 RepID=A0A3B7MHD4_9BACT|nr:hypothetical protein D3H65_07405 [Paraflavitalea soli]